MFDNIVTLFGMPRSGTTILARLIANHSRVRRIIEPYQRRRESQYSEVDIRRLCLDFSVNEESDASLLVKETTTRAANLELIFRLMEQCVPLGHRVAYIFVLRSPLETFLSQADAATHLWKRPENFSLSAKSLKGFWRAFGQSMMTYEKFALRYHRRIVFFDSLLREPHSEMARIMGLFGYKLESEQLRLSAPDRHFGGDPKACGSLTIEPASEQPVRESEFQLLADNFGQMDEYRKMLTLHEYIKAQSRRWTSSDEIVRDVFRLASG